MSFPVPTFMENTIGQLYTWCNDTIRLFGFTKDKKNDTRSNYKLLGTSPNFGEELSSWRKYKTIGDGTCLVHAVFQIVCIPYRLVSNDEKSYIGKIYRTEVMVHLPVFTMEEKREISTITTYLSDDIMRKWIHYLGFNVLLLTSQPILYHEKRYVLGNIMSSGEQERINGVHYIILYLINNDIGVDKGSHFESIGFLPYQQGLFIEEIYGGIDKAYERIGLRSHSTRLEADRDASPSLSLVGSVDKPAISSASLPYYDLLDEAISYKYPYPSTVPIYEVGVKKRKSKRRSFIHKVSKKNKKRLSNKRRSNKK